MNNQCNCGASTTGKWANVHYAECPAALVPTEPGYYWAKWISAAPDTREGNELTPALSWGVVEVWQNYFPPDEGDGEYFGVSVTGVETTQWLENFEWGPRVPAYSR